MGLFQTRRPRGFHHTYIYGKDERSGLPERTVAGRAPLSFRKKRKKTASGRGCSLGIRLVMLALLVFLLYYILNGSLTIL